MFRLGARQGANAMFRKGIATGMKVSKTLGGASRALSGAVKTGLTVGNAVLSNPAVRSAVAGSPEAMQALQNANKIAGAVGGVANILKTGSTIYNPKNYQNVVGAGGKISAKRVGENIGRGLERAKGAGEQIQSLYQYVQ